MFKDNLAESGGGIYNTDKSRIITNTDCLYFSGNEARSSGGAIYTGRGTSMLLAGNVNNFSNNSAHSNGGAIYCYHCTGVIVGKSHFINNYAVGDLLQFACGGAISIDYGNFIVSGVASFSNNVAQYQGGAPYLSSSNVVLDGIGTEFKQNLANDGGGLYTETSNLSVRCEQLKFVHNTAYENGGAINIDDTNFSDNNYLYWTALSGDFINNTAKSGGAKYADTSKSVTLINVTITGNSGSALCITNCNITFSDTNQFSNNNGRYGGAINSIKSHLTFTQKFLQE